MFNTCYHCNKAIHGAAHYGLHETCFMQSFQLTELEEFTSIIRHASSSMSSSDSTLNTYWNSSFFQGKFKKYSARLNNVDYILKIQENFAPELPAVEFLCNQIGKEIGIHIPNFYFLDLYDSPCFVTQNFVTNLPQPHTLDHIYHFIDIHEDYNCQNLIAVIERETSNLRDIEHFINICLFDALIGNHDRHGRNLGFLRTYQNTSLAPCYDNTSALGLETGSMLKAQFSPRGKIATSKSTEPTMQDYVNDFCDMGFKNQVVHFYHQLDLCTIAQIIENSFCSSLMKSAINKLIMTRYQELKNALYN